RHVAEEAVGRRQAAAVLELVAILLLELERHIDCIFLIRRLGDFDLRVGRVTGVRISSQARCEEHNRGRHQTMIRHSSGSDFLQPVLVCPRTSVYWLVSADMAARSARTSSSIAFAAPISDGSLNEACNDFSPRPESR